METKLANFIPGTTIPFDRDFTLTLIRALEGEEIEGKTYQKGTSWLRVIVLPEDGNRNAVQAGGSDALAAHADPTTIPGALVAHCCLGTACDLHDPRRWLPGTMSSYRVIGDGDDTSRFGRDGEGRAYTDGHLPPDVETRLGLAYNGAKPGSDEPWRIRDAAVDRTKSYASLVSANDDPNVTWVDMAAAMRAYYGFPPRDAA